MKHSIRRFGFIFLVLFGALSLGGGCATHSDPLAGWHFCPSQDPNKLNKSIRDDYQNYIQTLPSEDKKYAYYAHSFEDGTGQHAVQIEIPLNGTWWEHVLFYDNDNKRVKTVKYSNGGYRS
jgi:hypothetical protein